MAKDKRTRAELTDALVAALKKSGKAKVERTDDRVRDNNAILFAAAAKAGVQIKTHRDEKLIYAAVTTETTKKMRKTNPAVREAVATAKKIEKAKEATPGKAKGKKRVA